MSSELGITFRRADIDGLLTAVRAAGVMDPGLEVRIRQTPFVGVARATWGRKLISGDAESWDEAHEDAEAGIGTIETIRPANGMPAFDAFVLHGPYRQHTLDALRAHGAPDFGYATRFVSVSLRPHPDAGPLVLHFDRATAATGAPEASGAGPTWISTTDTYLLDRQRPGGLPAHIAAVELTDRLAQFGELERDDTTGYLEHRDADESVLVYLRDRQLRSTFRGLYAARRAA